MSQSVGSVRRLASHDAMVRRLVEARHPASGAPLFPSFRELACFAAVLGFQFDRAPALAGPTELFVDGRILAGSDQALDVLYLVGLAATRDQEILLDRPDQEDRLIAVFERYVNGGLEILSEWLGADPADPRGDRAILAAMARLGLLSNAPPSDADLQSVTF